MFSLFGIGFTAPWILAALAGLPILWILLRAVPPAPVRRLFPGVVLLLGLRDDDSQSDRTPWWLLLIRTLAIAAMIVGFAGPVLNPQDETPGTGPLLILMDGTWADARDWQARIEWVGDTLDQAGRGARPVAIAMLSDPASGPLNFQAADVWRARLLGLKAKPWQPDDGAIGPWLQALDGRFETFWLSDGLHRDSRAEVLQGLQAHGDVTVFQGGQPIYGLHPAEFAEGVIKLAVQRAVAAGRAELELLAHGTDPAGIERVLARVPAVFEPGQMQASVDLSVPGEIRNRITRFSVSGVRSAAAVSLTDDSLQRREVALISGASGREGLELLSPTHFLRQALATTADLLDGAIGDIIPANPDVIILADVATLAPAEAAQILNWVNDGGLLVRFAGPRLAASDVSRNAEDPLMPVRLRAGGRTVGGAMSWGKPKQLAPFAQGSPFYGLKIPADVTVNAQVLAEPDPTLSGRVIAALSDGTPLVTRKVSGEGQVVLFHVTANAQWSSLPLSGLFVEMLERLSVSTAPARPGADDLAGTTWVASRVLDGFGALQDAASMAGVTGEKIVKAEPGRDMPPGLYQGQERRIAVNVMRTDTVLTPARWPANVVVQGLNMVGETALKALFLALALGLLAIDALASLYVCGRLRGPRGGGLVAVIALLAFTLPQSGVRAQGGDENFALLATSQVVLAHVLTGNGRLDEIAQAGLRGLSDQLFARTSIEPADPIAVDLERDELSFFPLLYWPVSPDQPQPSAAAYGRLNRYLRTGGMILFDTRDADIAGFGAASPNGKKLQQLALPLDIPPLEPVPDDHVLTRAFYLMQEYPGRYRQGQLWVEAAPPDAQQAEGMPFRNLNDNVTPVVIGGNDWAAAWAVDEMGNQMFPVGRGVAGEKQREMAYRFGVNLAMYVLTGNYKSDQVHVPALLERLGE